MLPLVMLDMLGMPMVRFMVPIWSPLPLPKPVVVPVPALALPLAVAVLLLLLYCSMLLLLGSACAACAAAAAAAAATRSFWLAFCVGVGGRRALRPLDILHECFEDSLRRLLCKCRSVYVSLCGCVCVVYLCVCLFP